MCNQPHRHARQHANQPHRARLAVAIAIKPLPVGFWPVGGILEQIASFDILMGFFSFPWRGGGGGLRVDGRGGEAGCIL